MKTLTLPRSIQDRSVSKTEHVNHVFRRVIFPKSNTIEPIEMNTQVIILSGGGLVLPYFKDRHQKWKIVLVKQFRPAVKKITVEAPGGRLDSDPPEIALSRELLEETGIEVVPGSIDIVVAEYTHPSILSTLHIGGIVMISQNMVKNKKMAGNGYENEWTQVEVFDLVEILRKRKDKLIMIDLMTSRLIDEVAKTVGLLVKNY